MFAVENSARTQSDIPIQLIPILALLRFLFVFKASLQALTCSTTYDVAGQMGQTSCVESVCQASLSVTLPLGYIIYL